MLVPQPNTKPEEKEKEKVTREEIQDTSDVGSPVTVSFFIDEQGMVWLFTSLNNQYIVTFNSSTTYWLYSRQAPAHPLASTSTQNLLRLPLESLSTYYYDKEQLLWVRLGSYKLSDKLIAMASPLTFPANTEEATL